MDTQLRLRRAMNSVIAPVATSSIILHKVPQRMLLSEGQRDVFVSLEEVVSYT